MEILESILSWAIWSRVKDVFVLQRCFQRMNNFDVSFHINPITTKSRTTTHSLTNSLSIPLITFRPYSNSNAFHSLPGAPNCVVPRQIYTRQVLAFNLTFNNGPLSKQRQLSRHRAFWLSARRATIIFIRRSQQVLVWESLTWKIKFE